MSVTDTATRPIAPADLPPMLDVPDDADDAWWAHELTVREVADVMGLQPKSVYMRLRRHQEGSRALLPPLVHRAHRYYLTRRAYHDWVVGLHADAYEAAGRAERERLVEAYLAGASLEDAVQLRGELDRIDQLREQAAGLLKLADEIEQATLAQIRA